MKISKAYLFGFSALFILVFTILYLIFSEQDLTPSDYVASLASISIVFLTAAYVFITSQQLLAMKAQLDEMKKGREHISLPAISITPSTITLEKPRMFFSPPEKEYAGHSRLRIECLVSNSGNAPALSVNVCSCIMLQQSVEKHCGSFKSTMKYINILLTTEGSDINKTISFLFKEDREGKIINSIRDSSPVKAPILRICAAYKNVLGACFICRQAFHLFYNKEKQDEVLENWQSHITAFDSILKSDLKKLKNLYGNNDEGWNEIFQKSKQKYSENIIGEDQKLIAVQSPKSFTISTLSEEKYINMLSRSHYGQYISTQDECIAISETEQTK